MEAHNHSPKPPNNCNMHDIMPVLVNELHKHGVTDNVLEVRIRLTLPSSRWKMFSLWVTERHQVTFVQRRIS